MTSRAGSGRCGWSRSGVAPSGFEQVEGSEREIPAQLVLLAMGFLGPQSAGVVEQLGVELDERANVKRDKHFMTSVPGVFVAGDAGRGQSLIVWAIAEGRSAAPGVDAYLTGRSALPRPVNPTDRRSWCETRVTRPAWAGSRESGFSL